MAITEASVVHLIRYNLNGAEILLGKRKHPPHAGRWSGLGGKFKPGENAVECAIREAREETMGVEVSQEAMNHVATVDYFVKPTNGVQSNHSWTVHHFNVRDWSGIPVPSDEHEELRWMSLKQIPFYNMPPDLELWLPLTLSDRWVPPASRAMYGPKALQVEIFYENPEMTTVHQMRLGFRSKIKTAQAAPMPTS